MRRMARVLAGSLAAIVLVVWIGGCQDDVKKTKKVKRYEQEPVRMVSPGTEVVE